MKKTIFAIAILTISLVGTAWGQERRRAPRPQLGSTALGGGSGVGVKNRKATNLGDTATHEVGHKGKRRSQLNNQSQQTLGRKKNQDIEVENDETHRARPRAARTETVDKDETLTVSRGKRRKALPKVTP